jgi:hypothetical protein
MLSEARKREKIANAVLGTAMAVTAGQSAGDFVKTGHIESPGVALMQMYSKKRREAERNLDNQAVSQGARNIKLSREKSRGKDKYKKDVKEMKTFGQFCVEAYVPLRDSDKPYDDEGFPTRTRKWSKKMTDARMGVGKEKSKGRYGTGTPNISKGVAAARKLEKMKAVDNETESVRRKRGEAKQKANNMLGANRRRLQTSMDREHLEKSLKKEDFMMEMRKEDKVKGKGRTPLYQTVSKKYIDKDKTGHLKVHKSEKKVLAPLASTGRFKQGMKDPTNPYTGGSDMPGTVRHPHGGGGSGAKKEGVLRGKKKVPGEKKPRAFGDGPTPAQKVANRRATKKDIENRGRGRRFEEFSNWRDDYSPLEVESFDLITNKPLEASQGIGSDMLGEKCWSGYEKKGMKTMFGKRYPNCVKKKK